MRFIVNYFHSLFCKHEWEKVAEITLVDPENDVPYGYKFIYRCPKCGYTQKIKC